MALLDTGLDNDLLALDTGLEDSTMAADRPLYGFGSKVGRSRADVIVGDDGNFYNEDGERVYYWVVPGETDSVIGGGSETKGIGQDRGGYYTESEIRGAWDAKEGMGYLKKQVSWGNYWGFIQERQGLIQTGDLPDPTTPEYMADYPAKDSDLYPEGDPPPTNVGSSFGGGRDEEIYLAQQAAAGQDASLKAMQNWVDLNASLMNKYGIPGVYQNGDGDYFAFNGSTYSRVYKQEGTDWGRIVAGVMIGAVTGMVGSAIGSAIAPYAASLPGMAGYIGGKVAGAIGATAGATAGYEGVASGAFNPNVIVNLNEGLNGSEQGTGPDMTTPKEDINDDGTRTYGSYNLPPGYIYNDVRGVVIHEETGTEYPVTYTAYGNKEGGSPYNWIVNLPVDDGGGGGGGSDNSSQTTNSTATTTTTTTSTGAGGENPGGTYEGRVLTNKTYGDITIDDRDVWGEGNEYAGWVLVSNTGVWGQSGISVIYNPGTGFYQEIDWDNGTYDQRMEDTNQENPNPFDTSGTGGNAAGGSGDGSGEGQTSEPQPVEGDQCQLQDGGTGVIKDGVCVPNNSIISVNPNVWGDPNNPANGTSGGDAGSDTNSTNSTTTTTTTTQASTPGPQAGTGPGVITVGPSTWGTGTGTGTSGGGSGGGSGNGSGDGNGDGSGDGDGDGDGNGVGNGADKITVGGSSKTKWSGLYPAKEFQSRKGQFGKSVGTSREMNTPNYTAARQNLLFKLWDDLA